MRFKWLACLTFSLCLTSWAQAQPSRQMPGSRVFLPGMPNNGTPIVPNSRTRSASNNVGVESTDFYPKNGFPKILGDSVESGSSSGGTAAGATGLSGGGLSGGGLSGATGLSGGGGLTGGGLTGGGLSGNLGFYYFRNGPGTTANQSITGGGFSGLVPKGFGFGGTSFTDSWLNGR